MIRTLLATSAIALTLAPLPALARDSGVGRMAETMRDPATQQAMAVAIRAMSEAMLNMPLEPFARAAEAMGDRKTARRMRGSTVRDVAGRDAEDMPREISRKLPAMMGAMGGMAGAMEEMAPVLKDMAKDMGAQMGEAMRGARSDAERRDGEDYDAPPPSAREEPAQGPLATPAPDQSD